VKLHKVTPRCDNWEFILAIVLKSATVLLDRTHFTTRILRHANQRAEFHHRRIEV
jgi:hypothetical protein